MPDNISIKGVYEANTGANSWKALQHSLAQFSYDHDLDHPVLVTSVRKASTHLVRNFAAHFVGGRRTHWNFIGSERLIKEFDAFSDQVGKSHWLYTGHVQRNWAGNFLFRNAKVILVVRDPYTQVISRAMHFFHEDTREPFAEQLRVTDAPVEEAMFYAIFGANYKGWHHASIADEYSAIAAAWYDRADVILRYEDITGDPDTAVQVLRDAADRLGWMDLPDADERIRAAILPGISASYWKKTKTIELSDMQKATIEHLIPGVRAMFGYN